jgi:hypothetical protein
LDLNNTSQWSVATVAGGDFQIYDETGQVNRVYIKTDSGNIGVGTINPTAQLHISSASLAATLSMTSTDGPGITWTLSALGGGTSLGAGFQLFNPAASPEPGELMPIHGAPAISVDRSHNIAIGQPFPQAKLHVFGGASTGISLLIESKGSTDLIRARDLDTDNVRFVVQRLGNVGIGTVSPQAALHVVHTSSNSPIRAERGPTSATTPSVSGLNNGSGAGIAGQASANDPGSAGVLGRHNGGRAGVFGCTPCPLGAFPGSPAGDIGVAGFTASGSPSSIAVLAQTSACGKLFVGESPPGTAKFAVDCSGNLTASGTKSFVQAHPTDSTKQIVYVSLEGPEAGTYSRGTAKLGNGEAVVNLPEHFSLVTNEAGLTIQLTPRGEWLQLYVVKASAKQIIVREASGKSGQFDYFVQGVRKGYENHQVIQYKTR